jgi:hypothetical protein
MSNKTIFKRISLVAVAALGAGVLATSPATALDNNATGGVFVSPASNVMNIAVTPSRTGSALASIAAATSVGLLANSTTMGTGLTQTATLLSTGTLGVYGQSAAGDAVSFVVTGGSIGSAAATDTLIFFNSGQTAVASQEDASDAVTALSITVKPNSGVTSMRIEMYTKTVAETEASTLAIANGSVSRGTLKAAVNVTIATTSASGAYSAADSLVNVVASAATAATGIDEALANVIANNSATGGFIAINLLDAYGVSLDNLGALVITGTNGAGIAYAGDTSPGAPVNVTAVSNDTSGTIAVARPAAMAGKGFSTTVTISWNGTVVATKSFTFLGEVASMVVTPRRVGLATISTATTNADAFRVTYADSAGNALSTATHANRANTSVIGTTLTTAVTGAAITAEPTVTGDAAKGSLTCAAVTTNYYGGGTANLQLQHVNPLSGTVVKSNVFAASCQANAYTYTAGFDKVSYTPGSVATLTITFKDRDGDLTNGYDALATSATDLITVTGGPSATAVAIPATSDKPDSGTGLAGIKTFQFIVGSTEGDFQAVVSVPVVNGRNSSQTNQTVAYTVKSSSTSVSNADVLKSIVALIASINKQIQALQKLILARR